MPKLHEVLAVEPDIKNSTQAIISETLAVFKKDQHFTGFLKSYHPFKEDGEKKPVEEKALVTTVKDKLDHTHAAWVRAVDLIYQKESGNVIASETLVIDDTIIADQVPAVVLLSLESQLKRLKEVYLAAPTLDPVENWYPDLHKPFVSRTNEIRTYSTAKNFSYVVMVPATDRHPAQIEKLVKDEQVGEFRLVKSSGQFTPRQKSLVLQRIDNLIAAVKRARCRANEQEIENVTIGDKLVNYIFGPISDSN